MQKEEEKLLTNNTTNINNTLYKLQFDGCSKGNPGLAGSGSVIYNDKNEEIWHNSTFIGDKYTNNYAEYMGLIIGLKQAVTQNITHLLVEGDSMLVIKQMLGQYKVKSSSLVSLYNEAKQLEHHFTSISYSHIYREHNKRADELSNIALHNHT